MRIALVGDLEDLSNAYVAWIARRRGAEVIELAEDRLGEGWTFRLEPGGGGRLRAAGRTLALDDLDGAFVRLNPLPRLPAAMGDLPEELAGAYTLERRYGLHRLLEALPATVVNRPGAGRSNSSKPYQMGLLAGAGFTVPPWIAGNEPAAARRFLAGCPEGAVYKACSGLRSRVRRVDEDFLDRLAASPPVVLQRYVAGSDVRVHTVGGRTTFATRIDSSGVDYRFDEAENRYAAVDAPAAIRRRCLAVAAAESLCLAGFDFRVDRGGRWWCLEVNPVPTFLPYEVATGHRIADAVLELMAAGRSGARLGAPVELPRCEAAVAVTA